jgi:GT2 family glycosyltransferase
MSPRVLIVIVNYRTADLTIDALASLVEEVGGSDHMRVVVTDNDSGDGSAVKIQQAIEKNGWSQWARCMPLPRNAGFCYGNNEALRPDLASPSPSDYYLLLNPDTVVRPGAVTELLKFMEANPTVGVAGSRLEDPDTTVQISAFRFPSVLNEFDGALRLGVVSKLLRPFSLTPDARTEAHATDWVAGASMMVRREVFEKVGLLDEGYFLYYDEVDFCIRVRRAGWSVWYVPQSRVVHLVGQATGISDLRKKAKRRPGYWFESRRRYFLKHYHPLRVLAVDVAWMAGHAMWRLRRAIQGKPDLDPPQMFSDYLNHSVLRKGFRL